MMTEDDLRKVAAALTRDMPPENLRDTLKAIVPPPKPIPVDRAEVLALEVMVTALIGHLAADITQSTGRPAQSFVDKFSAICQATLLSALAATNFRDDVETHKALEHIKRIVGSVRFDGDRPN